MRKQLTFEFIKEEKDAQTMCERINKNATYYMRKKHPAHYTPWSAQDGSFDGFVVLYYR